MDGLRNMTGYGASARRWCESKTAISALAARGHGASLKRAGHGSFLVKSNTEKKLKKYTEGSLDSKQEGKIFTFGYPKPGGQKAGEDIFENSQER